MFEKHNIPDELHNLDEHWSQKILIEANGQLFKVAKGIGATNWHKHEDQDELFIVYEGVLNVMLRSGNVQLKSGDILSCLRELSIGLLPKRKRSFWSLA